ncbi:methyltransferase domain-containing protein [Aquabacter spiritensis]|uniref:Methyltransferase family protein n=1 Tax=Aquabacter spiritensis TaxID=933073 RepID=A0A4R3LPQ5_9HYPH|nr:methyltransferase domain-containing protein [Aquabacter spiritensis]TCT02474.1 methyltransferase family protein [Aquabacter spiritensis]
MRRLHFETLRPICPACRLRGQEVRLDLCADAEDDAGVRAGVLLCRDGCGQAYPILGGTPILVPDLAGWLSANLHLVLQSGIESEAAEAAIGAVTGPDSAFNIVRQQQSSYGHGHFGDLSHGDIDGVGDSSPGLGSVLACLDAAVTRLKQSEGPTLDIGCAVGGSTFRLAASTSAPVLGIDVNWPLLKVGRTALDHGIVTYPLRQGGTRYERRSAPANFPGSERVDFWIADALAPPFASGTFGRAVGLNILDCVADPQRLIAELARILRIGGGYALATPFDWASHATPPAQWIEGPAEVTRHLAAQNLSGDAPVTLAWHLRLHAQATMTYWCILFTGRKA